MNSVKTAKGTELPLLSLKGKNYLEVKWRLVWFREDHPAWGIETEYVVLDDKRAIAKATIKDEHGRVIATGHKREDQSHFPDHQEKAESGAIGRALALIGYGTQFAAELEEGDRIVDAPTNIEYLPNAQKGPKAATSPTQGPVLPKIGNKPATLISEPQRKRLRAIQNGSKMQDDMLRNVIKKHGFESSKEITRDKYDAICSEVEAWKA